MHIIARAGYFCRFPMDLASTIVSKTLDLVFDFYKYLSIFILLDLFLYYLFHIYL